MKRIAALGLGAAAMALAAAKPPLPDDTDAGAYRTRAIVACTAELAAAGEARALDSASLCGCALDRYLASRRGLPPPRIAAGGFRTRMEGELAMCAAEASAEPAAVAAPPPPDASLADKPAVATPADAAAASTPGERRAWTDWLAALPAWAWLGLVALAILLRLRLADRDPRKDLLGPPRGMRRGTPPPQAPRRPDLPR